MLRSLVEAFVVIFDLLCLVDVLERSIRVVLLGRVWKYSLSSTLNEEEHHGIEHFTFLDFSNKCFEKVFYLGAVVIEDDIETRHWLLAPL